MNVKGFVFLSSCLLAFSSFAQTGIIKSKHVSVMAEPDLKAEVLIHLDQGKRVKVLKQKGNWVQIHVVLDPSFSFDGWVGEAFVSFKKDSTMIRQVPVTNLPSSPSPDSSQGKSTSELDQFFETANGSQDKPSIRGPSLSPTATSSQGRAKSNETLRRRPLKGETFLDSLADRVTLKLSTGYLLYHYQLNTGGSSPGEVFAYNLPGMGLRFNMEYWFWERLNEKFRLGSSLSYQHGFYQFQTNLRDSSGAKFSDQASKSSSYDVILKFLSEYRFSSTTKGAAIGASLGIEYFQFSGDDLRSDTGPVQLYVSQRIISLLGGLNGRLPLVGDDFMGVMHFDVLALNFVKEDPSNATGSSPKGKIGFVPSLSLVWAPSEHHQLSTGYQIRLQKFQFKGNGVRVGNPITDGNANVASHYFSLEYGYLF